MAKQLVYKPHVLLASPSFDLYPFPIWNNKRIHNRRARWITATIIIHSWFIERATWPVPSKLHSNLPEARSQGNNWQPRLPVNLSLPQEESRNPIGTVLAHSLSVRSVITSWAKLYPIFWVYPKLEADFRVQPGWVWPSGSENGLNWVRTSKGVQIWVQDRHVLNKLDWTQFEPDWMGPQCPKLDQLWSGWPPGLLPKVYWALVYLLIMIHMLFSFQVWILFKFDTCLICVQFLGIGTHHL